MCSGYPCESCPFSTTAGGLDATSGELTAYGTTPSPLRPLAESLRNGARLSPPPRGKLSAPGLGGDWISVRGPSSIMQLQSLSPTGRQKAFHSQNRIQAAG